MQLNSISSSDTAFRSMDTTVTKQPPQQRSDETTFKRAEELNQALQSSPDIRQEAVTPAQEASQSLLYPPDALIAGVAHLLARNWPPSE